MKYRLNITRKAEHDIADAADYIEFVLYNPTAADDLLDEVEKIFNSLVFMPDKHALADDPVLRAWGIRFVKVKNYLAFYLIDESAGIIYVVRFMYSRRSWEKILRKEIEQDNGTEGLI